MQVQRKTLTQLSIPICFETLFYMLSGMVDTLMLSSVSDQAVGAVGTANTYISVFIIMFGVISSGMVAVMTQNIGAGKPGIAYQARQLGLIFNAVIGMLMSVFLAVFSGNILKMVSIAPALFDSANTYLRIVGGACFLNALIPIFSSYLRVFGYTKQSLWASIIGNVINFILNAVFLFVMNWGVMGVATATVISRIINLIIVATMGAVLIKAKDSPERIAPGKILGQIIKIGFPSACETALYNIAMTLVVRFMNQMDADGLNDIFWSLVILIIVAVFFYKFFLPKFQAVFDERAAKIEGGIAKAEQAQKDADEAKAKYDAQLSNARVEASKIRDDARAEASHIIADARTRAEADAAQITATAQRSIESQQQQALVSLKGEVGVLATALAGKILGSKLESDDVQSTMIDQMIAELDSDKK